MDPGAAVHEALIDVERLQAVATDLLTLARLEAGEKPRVEVLSLSEVIGGVRPPTTVGYAAGGDLGARVLGSRTQLVRLLQNLVDNAARHARSAVTVTVRRADGVVVLDVDDDGPGIAPDDREEVFTPFHRVDQARSRHDGGSGLGLAIVAEIARAHDGAVRVEQAPAGGARLRVELPAPDPTR